MGDCRLFLSPSGSSASSLCGNRAKRGRSSRGSHWIGDQSRGGPSKRRLNRVTTPTLGGVPLKRSPNELYLFRGLRNAFSFFNWFGSAEDEKFCEDIIAHLGDITKMKQLTRSHTNRDMMEGETMKKIFRHILTSSISYRVLNCVSYLISRYKVGRSKLCTLLNELSDEVKEMKDAENFLALHIFFLEDESVALFSMMHIMDFFRSKRRLMEAQDVIRKKIYDQCVNDLIRKKITKYKLFCQRKGIPFLLGDALDKIRLSEKEEDVYFSYDHKEMLRVFIRKISMEKGKGLGDTEMEGSFGEGGDHVGEMDSLRNMGYPSTHHTTEYAAGHTGHHIADETANHTADHVADACAQAEENENLMELKKTYQEIQSFNESIIKHIESKQRLFYFDENEFEFRKHKGKWQDGKHGEEGQHGQDEQDWQDGEELEEEEEDMESIQKRIDSYIHEYTKSKNMSMEQFTNEFVEQADLNFKAFLKGLRLGEGDVTAHDASLEGGSEGDLAAHDASIDGGTAPGLIASTATAGAPRQKDQLTTFKLKKLNEGDTDDSGFQLTDDILYERIRMKMLYLLQKVEYLKFKYQHEIINERYPIEKNEKTVLDVLKYGYKIVVSPDVDNSIFHQNRHVHGDLSSNVFANGVKGDLQEGAVGDAHEECAALRSRSKAQRGSGKVRLKLVSNLFPEPLLELVGNPVFGLTPRTEQYRITL
ncbi:hypothetical protein C922_03881 [Plasmodium inui San Antonio 1]|uniref:Uncharacterized protein n=1 Tax=Plasmodium inui San Antonio 1 TaxID=1237626 RepID=W7A1U7_9APIC|nr:hypothetical protein C922_03881 [Plasmodium inui San Antonio 1]EUD65635.1 hypothetical protein C922_03881 [Plasmodium inui San Antonio 1]